MLQINIWNLLTRKWNESDGNLLFWVLSTVSANKDSKYFRKCMSPSVGPVTGDNTLKWPFKVVSPSPFNLRMETTTVSEML
jgi:hypothetical protein